MNKSSENDTVKSSLRDKIIGLGEQSLRKSYYPQLVQQIDETEKSRRILAESEERYRSLVENINEIIFSLDNQGRVTYISPVISRLCSIHPSKVIGHPFATIVHQDDRAAMDDLLAHVQNGSDLAGEFRLLKPDDNIRYMHIACQPSFKDNQISGVTGILDDITERKQSEAEIERYRNHLENLVRERTTQLAEARDAAETANRAKSIFLANMSHELRTPLNAILGFSEMIERDRATPNTVREKVAIINRSGEHLLSMINDILDLSKIEAGKITVEAEATDLITLIEDISRMFEIRAQTALLRFSMELAPDIVRYVMLDGKKLRQVLINLLGNALKFTKEGGFSLLVRTVPTESDDETLRIHMEVKDSGPGIPEDQLDNIFNPFVQVETTATAQKGTGLGLSISKALIELMGGQIGVESTIGQGALFWVDVPAQRAIEVTQIKVDQKVEANVVGLETNQTNWRILIVEDNPENRLLLVTLLHSVGFEVREAENGAEAVALVEQWQPHFIWMDMRMPVMDGYEATRRIRTLNGGDTIKIVALTASVFREQRQHILDSGCNDIVNKPYRNHEIFDAMAKQIGVRYLYEQKETTYEAPISMSESELNRAVEGLAQEIRHELIEAAQRGDQERFEEALLHPKFKNSALSAALKQLSDDFQYDKVLALLIEKGQP